MRKVEVKNEPWRITVSCIGDEKSRDTVPCGQSWEITESDLVVRTVCVMGECDMEIAGFICPDCGTFTQVEYRQIPKVIWNRCVIKHRNEQQALKKGRKSFFQRIFG